MAAPAHSWKRHATRAALPLAIAAAAVLLERGAYARGHWEPWALLVLAGGTTIVRWVRGGRRLHHAAEAGALCAVGALALTQLTGQLQSPFYPLLYLLGAGYMLALRLELALPLIGLAIGLDAGLFLGAGALPAKWPLFVAHVSFTALFASLYHALLGARLAASRRAEEVAVKRRFAEVEESARELRLVATANSDAPERHMLAGVSQIEEALRGALAVAEAALKPNSVAVFLTSPDGETVRLREAHGEGIFRGPLSSKEGALGAVLSAQRPVRLEGPASISYYEGRAKVPAFCGVPLVERDGGLLGALVADRATAFSSDDERILAALGAEVVRAIEAERLLAAVRREKEEKARFFHALEELNRTTTVQQAADTAVAEARRMSPSLDLCALTLSEGRRHHVQAISGEAAEPLRDLSFADNAGLVSNVVKLGAPLPARPVTAMERVVIFDNGTLIRGLQSLRIFPLRAGGETVGTLVCASRHREAIPDGAQRELALLALQAAEAIVRTRLYEHAEKLATTDGLTGLSNRRTFTSTLEARLKEAQRYRRPLSLLLLDIDHFKKVNDTWGHPAGDAVLQGVAGIAQNQARETDLVARYGGEEMALILPETDVKGALAIAERVRKAVEGARHPTEQGAVQVTISVGVATFPMAGEDPAALLESCDKALYRAKQGGRNRVELARGRAAA